jgi:GAF domain-containing protein
MLLSQGTEHLIVAAATTHVDTFVVQLQDLTADQIALPESVVQYVARTHDYVILDDAFVHNQFSTDPYISEQHARSILCLPLLNQGKLVAVLYLENNLAADSGPSRTVIPAHRGQHSGDRGQFLMSV